MILQQYYLACLSHASYLVADEESRAAAIVDPQRDVDGYLADAEKRGLRIEWVLLTHFHADFVSGHLELQRRTGAKIALGARAKADYEFRPLRDGDTIDLGKVRLVALETPGHTPEAITFAVHDDAAGKKGPHAVLTGDTLFVGDVGRPDLLASVGVSADDLARMLYRSLREKLLPLPDDTLVYPAHGAGSMCGKSLGPETFSTIGAQRATNYALQPMDEEAFVGLVTAEQPEAPAYFAHDATVNRRKRDTLEQSLERSLVALSLEEVLARQEEGAVLLDVRPAPQFAAGHLAGCLNVSLKGKFATWCGSVLEPQEPIVLLADPGDEREAALRLGRIGYDRVVGFLRGGPAASLEARPDLKRTSPRVESAALRGELASPRPPVVVDVRAAGERLGGRIEGSLHVPLHRLRARMAEIPRDRPVVLHCAGGVRSMIALSMLERAGATNARDLVGGWSAWEASLAPLG